MGTLGVTAFSQAACKNNSIQWERVRESGGSSQQKVLRGERAPLGMKSAQSPGRLHNFKDEPSSVHNELSLSSQTFGVVVDKSTTQKWEFFFCRAEGPDKLRRQLSENRMELGSFFPLQQWSANLSNDLNVLWTCPSGWILGSVNIHWSWRDSSPQN